VASPPRDLLVVYLKGVAMGTADAIPGVSGGTIALITGIYERLIAAITSLDPRLLGHAAGLHSRPGRRRLAEALREMDVPFLLVLGAGVLTAVIVVARVAVHALEVARAPTYAFFFGLIAASAVVLYREVEPSTPGQIGAGVAGFAVAFVVAGASGSDVLAHSLPVVFLAGTIAISAMVLPGISGAAILILLGQYHYLSETLTAFVDRLLALLDRGTLDALVDPGTVVVTFLAGAVIGLLTVAHVIKRALDAYRVGTLVFLVSLLVGTLRLPVVEVLEAVGEWDGITTATILGAAAVGGLAVLALDYFTDDLSY